MLGVVLCGGQSSRMGTDKGLIKLQANTWAQTAVEKLKQLGLHVLLSINPLQYKDYAEVFSPELLIADNNVLGIHGPLCGVLSVHEKFPMQDLFVLACDMPLMELPVLQQLLDVYHADNSDDAFVFSNNGEPEPLCAIYAARGLTHIRQMHQENKLSRHSMKFMLDHLETYLENLQPNQQPFFRNFNAHSELNGL